MLLCIHKYGDMVTCNLNNINTMKLLTSCRMEALYCSSIEVITGNYDSKAAKVVLLYMAQVFKRSEIVLFRVYTYKYASTDQN